MIRPALDQAELLLLSAVIMLIAMAVLYLALAAYGAAFEAALRLIGVHAALCALIIQKASRNKWWQRFPGWLIREIRSRLP